MANYENWIKWTEESIEELRGIERVYKKNGKPFKNLKQNLKNCSIEQEILLHANYMLIVGKSRYSLTHGVEKINGKYWDKELLKVVDNERVINQTFIKPYYHLNIDEIWEKIQKLIRFQREKLSQYRKEYENYLTISTKIGLGNISINEIKEILDNIESSTLKRELKEFIKNQF